MSPRTLFTTLLACATFPFAAFADEEPPAKPVVPTEIESLRLRVTNDGNKGYFLFTENVLLTATNMRLECDQLEVFAEREGDTNAEIGQYGALKKVIATGNVRILQAEREATCGKAVVEPLEERIVLTENPIVSQAGMTFESAEIIIKRGEGIIEINPTSQNKRLHFTGPALSDLGFEKKKTADETAAADAPKTTEPPAPDASTPETSQPKEPAQ